MKKTNRELNQEHDQREQARVRPKGPEYNFAPLEEVMRQWAQERLNTQHE